VVAQGPWLGRDGFVAETAIQFDRVNASIARLEREAEKARQTIAEMAEEANRARRFQAFEETLKNSREYKLTDMQRGLRDLRTRLDSIEGQKSSFAGLTYKSFEAIDRKLVELSALQAQIERAEQNVRRNAMLLCGAAVLAVLAVGALLIALKANEDNSVVAFVISGAELLDGPFSLDSGIFTFADDADGRVKSALTNWGIAAVVYLVIGKILDRIIRP
jgi:uncharacterized phage infection (PIP) family protein YhgE